MRKHAILNGTRQNTVQTFQTQDLRSLDAKPDVLPVIEREKANRVSRSRQLDVLEYQPCQHDSALHLLQRWHLLFFARAGNEHIQDLRRALLQESRQDVQLMERFKNVQAQYREYMALESQTVSESVASQPVIASIRYGGLTIASGFWLPEEMEMGLSLLPRTGAHLQSSVLTLVEYCPPKSLQSLDVLLVTAQISRTKAELASEHLRPVDTFGLEKQVFTLSTPAFAIVAAGFMVVVDVGAGIDGAHPSTRPLEDKMQQAERVHGLGRAPSVSQLLEARQDLFVGDAKPQ